MYPGKDGEPFGRPASSSIGMPTLGSALCFATIDAHHHQMEKPEADLSYPTRGFAKMAFRYYRRVPPLASHFQCEADHVFGCVTGIPIVEEASTVLTSHQLLGLSSSPRAWMNSVLNMPKL